MRWKHKKCPIGTTKAFKKFLWWPLRMHNVTRWLEYAIIIYEYKSYAYGSMWSYVWKPYDWGDLTEEEKIPDDTIKK